MELMRSVYYLLFLPVDQLVSCHFVVFHLLVLLLNPIVAFHIQDYFNKNMGRKKKLLSRSRIRLDVRSGGRK